MQLITLLIALLPALTAYAQSSSSAPSALPSGASALPTCALSCTTQVLNSSDNGGCTSVADTECICTSSTFQRNVYQCYVNTCTAEQLQAAEAFGANLCQSIGHPIDTAVTPSGITGTPSGASSMLSSSTDASATSSEAASSADSAGPTSSSAPDTSDAMSTSFNLAAIGAAMIGGLMAM